MSAFEQGFENKEISPNSVNPWENIALPQLSEAFTSPTDEDPKQNKEALVEQAELVLSIDKQKLKSLELPSKLEHLRETYMKLPERLEFQPGVNLIFGPNGSGKTTFSRAIYYAIEARERYDERIKLGDSEKNARQFAQQTFELPRSRGTDFEEYLMAGAAPLLATAFQIERYSNNTYPHYCNTQEEVGRHAQLQREMVRRPGIRHIGDHFMEYDGDRHSSDELQEDASDNLSARQTVDRDIESFLDITFSTRKWDTENITGVDCTKWEIPKEFSEMSINSALGRSCIKGGRRKREYYPGIAFIDEPETGLDVQRHINLPNSIETWYPSGSIMLVPTNSTELYRSELARLDLASPDKGIHIPVKAT